MPRAQATAEDRPPHCRGTQCWPATCVTQRCVSLTEVRPAAGRAGARPSTGHTQAKDRTRAPGP